MQTHENITNDELLEPVSILKHICNTEHTIYNYIFCSVFINLTVVTHTQPCNIPSPKSGHVFLHIFTQLSQVNASGQAPTAMAARHNML